MSNLLLCQDRIYDGLINEQQGVSIIYAESLFSINGSDNNDTSHPDSGRCRDPIGFEQANEEERQAPQVLVSPLLRRAGQSRTLWR